MRQPRLIVDDPVEATFDEWELIKVHLLQFYTDLMLAQRAVHDELVGCRAINGEVSRSVPVAGITPLRYRSRIFDVQPVRPFG